MKLLNSFGPNPRMVRMFLHEKGLDLEKVEHDLMGAENRAAPYTSKNPGGQMPALETDGGDVIAETVVICDYLEELHPEPALIGANALERAEARMWNRRIEQRITEHMYAGFRFSVGLGMFKGRMYCMPDAADDFKAAAQDGLTWLDGLLGDNDYLCGERLTIGDMVLFCCVDFAAKTGQTIPAELSNLTAWYERMAARPSASASLHPAAAKVGMQG
ncbi:MAG: glutathione S-transferase family protein [Pseudomonadota bacterium]